MFTKKIWQFFAPETAAAAAPPAAAATPAATPAAQPAAAEPTAGKGSDRAVAAEEFVNVEDLTPGSKEYRDWQKTGNVPKKGAAKPAAAAGQQDPELDELGEEETAELEDSPTSAAETAADAARTKPAVKREREDRYHKLVDNLQEKDRKIADLEARLNPKPAAETKPGAAQPAKEKPLPGMDDVDETTGKPKYTTIDDYLTARDEALTERLLGKLDQRTDQRQKERMSQEKAREINDQFRNRLEKAREKHADYDTVALNPNLRIPADSAMESIIVMSEYGPEITYMLGQDPAEAARIAKLDPIQQGREMFLLELLAGDFEARLAKDKRFSPKLTAKVKITAAGRPSAEIGGSGTLPADEVDQAAKDSDSDPHATRRYIDAANRRAIERRKGK